MQLLSALPLLCLVGLGLFANSGLGRINESIGRIYDDRVVPLQQLKVIADDYAVLVIDAVNKANAGLVSAPQALRDVQAARHDIEQNWRAYLATRLTPDEERLVAQARQLFATADARLAELERALAAFGNASVAGQLTDYDGPLYAVIDPISNKITELVDLQLRVAATERQRSSEHYAQAQQWLLWVTLLVLLLVVVMGHAVGRSVILPLATLRDAMRHIATKQDLRHRVEVSGDDELADVSIAVNRMLERFNSLVREISGNAEQLAAASEQMAAIGEQTSSGLDRQQSQTEQVATAMNQMTASVHEVADSASHAAASAQQADGEAQRGATVVRETGDAIRALAEEVGRTAGSIGQLEEQSVNIGSVVDVIGEIAEQTNLLALNAAIEAARAGDQGRGFAVVADEVRTLASRTQQSTGEIQTMIERLQQGTKGVVKSMEGSHSLASDTVHLIGRTGETLQAITGAVAQIRDMSSQIAAAAEQQGRTAESINRNVTEINEVTRDSSEGAAQTATASQELARLAINLQQQVSQFVV